MDSVKTEDIKTEQHVMTEQDYRGGERFTEDYQDSFFWKTIKLSWLRLTWKLRQKCHLSAQ